MSSARRHFAAITIAIAALASTVDRAHAQDERPSTGSLVLAGLAMAPPTYFLGVIAHEGSHALAAKMVGAEVLEFHILPGRYGRQRNFHFGFVRVRGLDGAGQKSFFWLAPKIVDLLMLGGYSIALATDALPDNRYGLLAFTVVATGFWVDFSKDIPSYWASNDVVKTYNVNGLRSEWSRLPFRVLHAGLSIAASYALFKGYDKVFEDEPTSARILPLWVGAF